VLDDSEEASDALEMRKFPGRIFFLVSADFPTPAEVLSFALLTTLNKSKTVLWLAPFGISVEMVSPL
jgi:hypothetical protein